MTAAIGRKARGSMVHVPTDLYDRIRISAQRHRRTIEAEISWAIEQYLDERGMMPHNPPMPPNTGEDAQAAREREA